MLIKNENMQFSVIVPCYNASTYVSIAIESVLKQSYNNWELILINDGSLDNTLDILYFYASNDERIKVFDVPNGGVSKARNYGLDVAQGDWIVFLDADDWFEENAFSVIKQYLNRYPNCDILGFNHFYNLGLKQWKESPIFPKILQRTGADIEWLRLDMMFPYYDVIKNEVFVGSIRAVWGKVFKRKVITSNHLHFIENLKVSEDAIFCMDVFKHASEIILFNEYLTHYRVSSSSTMNNYEPNIISINEFALDSYYQRRYNFVNISDFENCYLGMVSECIFRVFKLYILHKKCNFSYKKRKEILLNFLNFSQVKSVLNADLNYLPFGKKQLVYCARKHWYGMMFIVAFLSIQFLKFRQKK